MKSCSVVMLALAAFCGVEAGDARSASNEAETAILTATPVRDDPAKAGLVLAATRSVADDELFDFETLGHLAASHGPYDHNGSLMKMAFEHGLIVYEEPKVSLNGLARKGTVLFRGQPFKEGGKLSGTAYAFKQGCPPAPYQVTGGYSKDRATVTLRGAGPVREGCRVVGLSSKSPHSVLVFRSLMSD